MRQGGDRIERARDLFEQALEKCPSKFSKPLYLLYGKLEEEHGLAKRAINVYERATKAVEPVDKFEVCYSVLFFGTMTREEELLNALSFFFDWTQMYEILIAKAAANFGLAATRPIYQSAIEALPDRQTAEMCLRFASLERKLGEIDRARAIYAHASQFCDPRVRERTAAVLFESELMRDIGVSFRPIQSSGRRGMSLRSRRDRRIRFARYVVARYDCMRRE
jgi:pre-mRNA-splicing factor SYF1